MTACELVGLAHIVLLPVPLFEHLPTAGQLSPFVPDACIKTGKCARTSGRYCTLGSFMVDTGAAPGLHGLTPLVGSSQNAAHITASVPTLNSSHGPINSIRMELCLQSILQSFLAPFHCILLQHPQSTSSSHVLLWWSYILSAQRRPTTALCTQLPELPP